MLENFAPFKIIILPRQSMSWQDFVAKTPNNSIALDGVVLGGPNFDPHTNHLNFDHHDMVVREATMSTAMQVYFAIKGGLMESFRPFASIYINDTDQDTTFAVWLLLNYKKFEGTQSIPLINRLLALSDRWDITGGAFPMSLEDRLVRQFSWVFHPYSELRKCGQLSQANEVILRNNLECMLARLNMYLMGQAQEIELDTRHEILYDSLYYKIVDEIGGTDARYFLFNKGMQAFISIVARRSDGRFVYSIGRRSRYIPFPIPKFYEQLNKIEGLTLDNGWNGSDIVGGSSRQNGSGLSWMQVRDIANAVLEENAVLT